MNHLDNELQSLRELLIEMMELVKSQFEKSKKALIDFDVNLAEEIVRNEMRVNALELNIEKECENTIALYQPVATDLRFVIAVLKSISDLERIGDHADGIAKLLLDRKTDYKKEVLIATKTEDMFDFSLTMFSNVTEALYYNNTDIARRVFKQDKELNKKFRNAIETIVKEMEKKEVAGFDLLTLYSILAKIERSGDLLTNVAEQIIFYIDAEVVKHKKKNKKNQKIIDKSQKE